MKQRAYWFKNGAIYDVNDPLVNEIYEDRFSGEINHGMAAVVWAKDILSDSKIESICGNNGVDIISDFADDESFYVESSPAYLELMRAMYQSGAMTIRIFGDKGYVVCNDIRSSVDDLITLFSNHKDLFEGVTVYVSDFKGNDFSGRTPNDLINRAVTF